MHCGTDQLITIIRRIIMTTVQGQPSTPYIPPGRPGSQQPGAQGNGNGQNGWGKPIDLGK
jgi:hypothetical protein